MTLGKSVLVLPVLLLPVALPPVVLRSVVLRPGCSVLQRCLGCVAASLCRCRVGNNCQQDGCCCQDTSDVVARRAVDALLQTQTAAQVHAGQCAADQETQVSPLQHLWKHQPLPLLLLLLLLRQRHCSLHCRCPCCCRGC